jgi:hypothetical protein
MFGFDKVKLSLSFGPIFFVLALILLVIYTVYVYRYTIPEVSTSKKVFLITLRSLALMLLIFIFFEPILTLAKKVVEQPVNLVFIDNSRSIQIKDGTKREESINNFINGFGRNGLGKNTFFYSFGTKVNQVSDDSLQFINFDEGSTNFSKIFSQLEKNNLPLPKGSMNSKADRNISSIVIASDGVITDGTDPTYTAEKMNLPVYTFGVGDTSHRNDVEIKNVLYNEYIYAQNPTVILATIGNSGFVNKSAAVSIYEDNKIIDQKNITLNSDGIQNVSFIYTPKTSGDKKITISVKNQLGEFTYANNKKAFFVNVKSNKLKVMVIAGSPSSDLSFIKNSLEEDTNLVVNSVTVVAQNKFLEQVDRDKLLDSAQVLFLVGFPSKETPDNFYKRLADEIQNKNKPFLITVSGSTDFNKLMNLKSDLPFSIGRIAPGTNEVQPVIPREESENPLLQNNADDPIGAWQNLPPVYQTATDLGAKPESEILARTKINNVPMNKPLIVTRKIGNKRSIAVLANDIWRWKLQSAQQNLNLFDSFIHNSVKWLNISNQQKQFTLRTNRKFYAINEPVEFSAQVYDETFNPISDADVRVEINNANQASELQLNSVGNGLYEGTYNADKPGDYSFTGAAEKNNNRIGKGKGEFNVGDLDIEMINPRMDSEFLKSIANLTGGKFYNTSDYNNLYKTLKERIQKSNKEKIETSEITLWSDEWLMIIAILLFALEWFYRKRFGML